MACGTVMLQHGVHKGGLGVLASGLCVQQLPTLLVDLQGSQNVELLGPQVLLQLPRALGQLCQQLRCVRVPTGLLVELHCMADIVLLHKVVGILGEVDRNLWQLMLLGQLHGLVPLVQLHAAVHGSLDFAPLRKCLYGGRGESDAGKLVGKGHEQRATLRQLVNQTLHGLVVLEEVVELNKLLIVLGLPVVLHCLSPLLTVCVVVPNVVPGLHDEDVVPTPLLHQLHHLEPVAQPHPQLHGQVLAVNVLVDLLRLVELLEVRGHLRHLLLLVPQQVQLLDKLDPLVVLALHKGFLGNCEVHLLK
mmetsp:Transcript_153782/g.268988  ORF Transcript_153782/g.268988 Transcript_153782/m.268988 type:complete len:304 (-) Transcript_153782:2201-3112(-)